MEIKSPITPEEIKAMLERALAGAHVEAEDMTGTLDHFEVRVVWSGFSGKNLIEQHQTVNKALAGPLEDGRIHALKIKTHAK